MLTAADARRRAALRLVASLMMVVGLTLTGGASAHADAPSPGSTPSAAPGGLVNGITVSWPSTTKPVEIEAGETATSSFWVTNDSDHVIPVTVGPAKATPGDNGSLNVSAGADPRFHSITLTPERFRAAPGVTTEVTEKVVAPANLPPGVYLLPALVQPHDRLGKGDNIRIERAVAALTTFRAPGDVDVNMHAELTTVPRAGAFIRDLPGLPSIEVGRSAAANLRITSASSAGTYAYYEVTGTSAGIGALVLDGHTLGAVADVRGDPSLYFPGLYRDFPLSWRGGILGAAKDNLTARVSFNPTPTQVASVETSISLIVVSPWWLAIVLAALALALVALASRTTKLARAGGRRRATTSHPRRGRDVTSSALLAVVGVAVGSLAIYWVLGVLIAVGVAAVVAVARSVRGLDPASAARRMRIFQGLSALLLLGSCGVLAWSLVGTASPSYALTGTAALALWLVAGFSLLGQVTRRSAAIATEVQAAG